MNAPIITSEPAHERRTSEQRGRVADGARGDKNLRVQTLANVHKVGKKHHGLFSVVREHKTPVRDVQCTGAGRGGDGKRSSYGLAELSYSRIGSRIESTKCLPIFHFSRDFIVLHRLAK